MALSVAGTTTGTATTGDCTLTSWTPVDGETLILAFATRQTGISPVTVSGNGQSWVELDNSPLANTQGQFEIHVYAVEAVSGASTGSILVELSGNTKPVAAIAVRISGQHASPFGAFATAPGPAVDDDDMLCAISTASDGSWALAFGSHRAGAFTVPGDEVSVSVNLVAGSGGDLTTLSCWYLSVPTAGSVTVGAANDLGSARDWSVWAVEIEAAAAAATAVANALMMMGAGI